MNEVGIAFVLGICAGIAIMLIIIVNICNKDTNIKKIKRLQEELIKKEKQNLRLRKFIVEISEVVAEGDEEDGREEVNI